MPDLDLSESIIPKSDQLNADEMHQPATYTIRDVKAGSKEQPFDFLLEETDRAYRPSKTMRRMIVEAWGSKTSAYVGRRLTLYREPSITFGGQKVGGIRISHMSDIPGPVVLAAQVTKGKRETFTVQPIEAGPATNASTREVAAGAGDAPAAELLNDAIARQVREMTPDEKKAFGDWLEATNLGTKLGKLAEAFGESARDLAALVAGNVMPS